MMNCIIVDDEQPARVLLESYVSKITEIKLVAVCKNAEEAIEVINKNSVDLIITDIQMPGKSGTDFIKSLEKIPLVIFSTAYRDYAMEGFELDAVDYLLKPYSFERFQKAITKAFSYFELKGKQVPSADLKTTYLTIKADHKLYKVQYADIRYIEGMREYVSFYTPTGRITALMSLKFLEQNLPQEIFVRCHKSYIVNKNVVEALDGHNLIVQGKQIPVGQLYKEDVLKNIF
ncbi:MAG: response regulator transcription factor [Crocinitomicaceae bacterium]|nr:response regulator transcription factor [Crocinitomicaceae bacterium]